MKTIEDTLKEREARYGKFEDFSDICQSLKQVLHGSFKWDSLSHEHREALEMIAHKMARVLNGDPNYADNWHDISGYAKLAEDATKVKQ